LAQPNFFLALSSQSSSSAASRDSLNLIQPSQSQSYVMTDSQSASLSWCQSSIWGLRPDFYYCQTIACSLMWGVLPDERTGLSFTIAADPRQHSHSQVRVQWDSRSYFTLSDSRLPFSSPPTTRRVTVEVFEPAATRDSRLIQPVWIRVIEPWVGFNRKHRF
jgi:hypothetical protein